jgi:hypothetical protein
VAGIFRRVTISEERKAANEAAFREANERIREVEQELQPPLERVPYLCECEDTSCREPIRLARDEYERIRSDPTWFLIAPGHPTDGDVVYERDGYSVVHKTGRAAEVAVDLDPRDGAR